MPTVASYCRTFLKPEMRHIYRQVTALDKYDTFVICKERKNVDVYPFDPVEPQPHVRSNFLRRFWLKYLKGEPPIVYRGEYGVINRILARRHADLMHVYFGDTGVHLLPFIDRWPKPTVVSFHGMDVQPREHTPGYADKLRELLGTVPLVMARSGSLKERLLDLGCPEHKIRMNRTGIPLENYPFAVREFPKDGAWKFVQACRLVEKKGLDITLNAFAQFKADHPKSTIAIAGEGPLLEKTQKLAKELGIEESVSFPGFLDQAGLRDLYHKSHVFVHPSQITADQNQEGIPNSMLEAMATGLPVLSTFHGGIPEAVDNGKTGLLVPERDTDGLLDNMRRFAADESLWREMGEAASQDMRDNFEHSAQIAKLEAVYDEAVEIGKR